MLREAGYGDGFSMDVWVSPVQRIYNPNATKTAELLQAHLAKVGVELHIKTYGWGVFLSKLHDFKHDSVLLGWTADNADPDNFFRPLFSCAALLAGTNRMNWCDPAFDKILTDGLSHTAHDACRKYYLQAQEELNEALPLIPLAHALRFQVKNRNIHGMPLNPYGGISFAKAHRKK